MLLGCHPHLPQEIECYKDRYIVYSMVIFAMVASECRQ
ncbi:MAG: CapA family protein [Lachnospiraceae bacterium]|nr:CapA family protein [Lachnospiraceae bacterium]